MPPNHLQDTLPLGTRLGGYDILRVLGRGGFGITYSARARTGQMVAIKEWFPQGLCRRAADGRVIPAPGMSRESDRDVQDAIAMFVREADIICSLHHPHLVRGIDWMEENGTAYLVMDYVSGKSLQEHLRSPGGNYRVTPATMAQLCQGILSALACLHEHDIQHADIKPDNIFLGVGFHPLLIDLGSAHLPINVSEDAPLTYSRHYSAIEQSDSKFGGVGPWTDIYQFSAVLYRCLTSGRPPDAKDRAAATRDRYIPLVEQRADLAGYPLAFLQAIDAGLALHPRDRPPSISAWWRLLEPALQQMTPTAPSPAAEPPPPVRIPEPPHPASQPPSFDQPPPPADLLARLGLLLLGVVLILLVRHCAS